MSKCSMWTQKTTSEKWKFNSNKKLGREWLWMDRENHLEKKSDSKNWKKTVNIRVKLPHVNKKPLPRNWIFVQTPFFHSTLKLERKNFTPQNHSLFRSTSCFGVTKITTPIWLQKSWIVKNHAVSNNSQYRFAAIKKEEIEIDRYFSQVFKIVPDRCAVSDRF